MKKALTIGMAVLGAMAASMAGARWAMAEERMVSENFSRQIQGDQWIDVLRDLNVFGRARLNSIIIVASTAAGQGVLEVIADGARLMSTQVGTTLTSFQVPVGRNVGRGLQSLQLHTRGNFTLAMLAVTLDEDRDDMGPPGRPRPMPPGGPGYGGRPGYNPAPVPAPGYNPAPVPAPGYGGGYPGGSWVNESEFSAFMTEMNRESFDSGRANVLNLYVSYWGGRFISMGQLAQIVGTFDYDSGRVDAVRSLKPSTVVDVSQIGAVLNHFDFDSSRNQAREILMSR